MTERRAAKGRGQDASTAAKPGRVRRISAEEEASAEPRAGSWTAEEMNLLIRLWKENVPNEDIAGRIGRTRGAISVKANRLGLQRHHHHAEEAGGTGRARICLGCARSFWSQHAGIRFCDPCKSGSNWRTGGGYSIAT